MLAHLLVKRSVASADLFLRLVAQWTGDAHSGWSGDLLLLLIIVIVPIVVPRNGANANIGLLRIAKGLVGVCEGLKDLVPVRDVLMN